MLSIGKNIRKKSLQTERRSTKRTKKRSRKEIYDGSKIIEKSGMSTKENIENVRRKNERNSKGQFIKGMTPFNKGLKQTEYMSPDAIRRTRATQYKKGNLPHNANPLGTITCCVHERYGVFVGFDWFINIDSKGKRHNHYNYRKYLWETFYGEDAPKGMIFIAKDGDQSKEPTIDNIEMIDRAEHLRRNNPRTR